MTYLQKQPSIGVLIKWCSEDMHKYTGEHACWRVISIKFQSNFVEITLRVFFGKFAIYFQNGNRAPPQSCLYISKYLIVNYCHETSTNITIRAMFLVLNQKKLLHQGFLPPKLWHLGAKLSFSVIKWYFTNSFKGPSQ